MRALGPNDHVIRLRDGRALGYTEFGDPAGFPVINNHGGLIGRLDVQPAETAARKCGIRLISPDRPGIGLSDFQRGRDTLDWADDARELAQQLRLNRFAVMGWSMGGQYAAAIAYKLPDRVTQLTLIASALPMDEYLLGELNTTDKLFTWLVRDFAPVAGLCFSGLGFLARRTPRLFTRVAGQMLSTPDRAVLGREPIHYFSDAAAEALSSSAGMIEEYRAWVRPWRFKLVDIKVPTRVWGAECDSLMPSYWAKELAGRIPGARVTMCKNEGHFLAHNHYEEIFQEMTAAGGEARTIPNA